MLAGSMYYRILQQSPPQNQIPIGVFTPCTMDMEKRLVEQVSHSFWPLNCDARGCMIFLDQVIEPIRWPTDKGSLTKKLSHTVR